MGKVNGNLVSEITIQYSHLSSANKLIDTNTSKLAQHISLLLLRIPLVQENFSGIVAQQFELLFTGTNFC